MRDGENVQGETLIAEASHRRSSTSRQAASTRYISPGGALGPIDLLLAVLRFASDRFVIGEREIEQ